jgi:hypothetical protein
MGWSGGVWGIAKETVICHLAKQIFPFLLKLLFPQGKIFICV